MATCNAQTLIDAAGEFRCLCDGDRWSVLLSLFCKLAKAATGNPMACNVQTLLNDGACFQYLDDSSRWSVLLQLACEILQGGGTGGVCIVCVDAAPLDDGPCDCSLAYGKKGTGVDGWLWTWDVDSGTWELILGGP